MNAVCIDTFYRWQKELKQFQLIDVRELHEHEACNIGGINIPMGEIINRISELNNDKSVLIYCKSGQRSEAVVEALKLHENISDIFFLEGGIAAFANKYKPELVFE